MDTLQYLQIGYNKCSLCTFLPRKVSKSRKTSIYIDDSDKVLSLPTSLSCGNKAVCVDAMSATLLQTAAPGTRSHTALFSHSLDTEMVPCEWMSPMFALYQRVIAVKKWLL